MKRLLTLIISGLSWLSSVNAQVNYTLVCVDSVWYDSTSAFINVRIYNGDTTHMNYPSVQIVSPPPANDTIGNPSNFVNFFAQLQNTYQVYTDTITQPGILDFSSYTFLMHEGFGASTGIISWCGPTSVEGIPKHNIHIYPNPVTEKLFVTSPLPGDIEILEIYSALGNLISHQQLKANSQKLMAIDVSELPGGIYFVRTANNTNISGVKFIKQ